MLVAANRQHFQGYSTLLILGHLIGSFFIHFPRFSLSSSFPFRDKVLWSLSWLVCKTGLLPLFGKKCSGRAAFGSYFNILSILKSISCESCRLSISEITYLVGSHFRSSSKGTVGVFSFLFNVIIFVNLNFNYLRWPNQNY